MDRRAAGLAAGTLALLCVCTLAAVDPARARLGDSALVVAGVACAALVWQAGRRVSERMRGWRLLALAPLCTASGAVVAAVVPGLAPVQVVGLRLIFMIPAYVLSCVGGLTLVAPEQLRAGGRRMAIELALFTTAVLVVVQFVYTGFDGRWSDMPAPQTVILAAAVAVTSINIVGALVVLGSIEPRRQKAALALLVGAGLLTAGRGLGTAGLVSQATDLAGIARFFVVLGMAATVLAALIDPGHRGVPADSARARRTTQLGQVLPHVTMVAAMTVVAVHVVLVQPPSVPAVAGALLCGALSCVHRWVSARAERRTAAALRRSEAYFRSLVRASGDAVVLLDGGLRVSWGSPALDRVLGEPAAARALAGQRLGDVVHPDDAAAVEAALLGTPAEMPGLDDVLLVLRLQHADGTWRRLEAGVSDLRTDPAVRAVVLHCRDITERYEREETLRSVAYTDPMTGMPNRAGLVHAVDAVLAEDRPATGAAVLLIEIDGLLEAREDTSWESVSRVIEEVGRRLRATVREDDVVARLGVGVFAALAREEGTEADQLADRCLAVVDQPIVIEEGVVDLSATVGVAALEPDDTVDAVLARAEMAARAARAGGNHTAARYVPELGEAAVRRDRLRADLPGAQARGELSVVLQPIVSLGEQRVAGLEGRLRWRHSELGDITAAEFLPVAERTGLVADLHRWGMEEAMRVTASMPTSGAPLRLGIDVPTGWAAGGTLLPDVEAALSRTGFEPERLVLELTEDTVLAGDERVRMDLRTLRLMGAHIALDDFGAGEASLASLTVLPIDILKLDRSFLARVDRDPQSRALYESVVGIGRALGLDVVAEGVETPAQLAAAHTFGVGFAQGFLIGRPMPPDDLACSLAAGAGELWPGLVESR